MLILFSYSLTGINMCRPLINISHIYVHTRKHTHDKVQ